MHCVCLAGCAGYLNILVVVIANFEVKIKKEEKKVFHVIVK